jgi:transposase
MDCTGEIAGCDHLSGAVRDRQKRWCRAQGIYTVELEQWCANATTALAEPQDARASPQATRQDRKRIKELERELLRKDRALAETTALLVLSKKVAAIYNKGEDA